jgi:cyclopropane-fatty-acyl-phospholipid synthase
MAERAQPIRDRDSARAIAAVQLLLSDYHPRDFAVELWDGTCLAPESGQFCRFTWNINHPGALRNLLRSDRQVALGEAYIFGDFEIEGDILACFGVGEYLATKHWSAAEKVRIGSLLLSLPSANKHEQAHLHGRVHSKSRDRQAISFHYDVSNDFYQLWLDEAMVYSCAYFRSQEDDLNTAQELKLDYICRKLRLKSGERLLDIGCGWGGLVLHAAQNYGVEAIGITLSQQQQELAKARIQDAGLSSRCRVELLDYRDAARLGTFDKLASIGMVEHVGKGHLSEYFERAFVLLKPGGVFLNHGIGHSVKSDAAESAGFIKTYVFPDSDLVPIFTMLEAAEKAGFEVRDVENLREHYALTLRHWVRRLEAREPQARELVGDLKYRIWRLYMAGCAYYFRNGDMDLYQSLLVKTEDGCSRMPLTREDWYPHVPPHG